MKAPVGWLCYHNVISGDLNIPYADKGRRHISIWDNFHISTILSRGGIFYIFNITLENDIRVFRNITKSSSWSFRSFPLSQKYSLWGFVDQRKLLSRDKQEIVPNPAGFALLSNQLSKSTSGNFPFMKIWLWRESLLFVCRKKVFANQRSWWGRSRMIGSDYPIVGLFSGSAERRIASD